MTTQSDWQGQVGRSWAEMAALTDRALAGITAPLLARIAGIAGNAIADIGCGAGELSLALADARPEARIVGVDVSPELLDVANARAAGRPGVRFELADAAQWRPVDFAPDLLVSRHGVMFFDDPPAAFAHLAAVSRPGARMVFSCFSAARENHWASDISALLPADPDAPPPNPHAPGAFAFADPDHVRAILTSGGWSDVALEPVDFAFVVGEGKDPVADAERFFSRIGPAASLMARLPAEPRSQLKQRIGRLLAERREGDRIAFPAAAWIVSARKG